MSSTVWAAALPQCKVHLAPVQVAVQAPSQVTSHVESVAQVIMVPAPTWTPQLVEVSQVTVLFSPTVRVQVELPVHSALLLAPPLSVQLAWLQSRVLASEATKLQVEPAAQLAVHRSAHCPLVQTDPVPQRNMQLLVLLTQVVWAE